MRGFLFFLVWDLKDEWCLFINQLIQIIINSLLKIAIKFKEFLPKVVLVFTKILRNKDIFLKHIVTKVEENLALMHYTSISSVLFSEEENQKRLIH